MVFFVWCGVGQVSISEVLGILSGGSPLGEYWQTGPSRLTRAITEVNTLSQFIMEAWKQVGRVKFTLHEYG